MLLWFVVTGGEGDFFLQVILKQKFLKNSKEILKFCVWED